MDITRRQMSHKRSFYKVLGMRFRSESNVRYVVSGSGKKGQERKRM